MLSPDKTSLNALKESVKYNEDATEGSKELFNLLIDHVGLQMKAIDDGLYIANFVYKPNRINVTSNEGALDGETFGTLSVLLSRKSDGQTFVSKDYENLSLPKLNAMEDSDLIRRIHRIPGVKAFANGHPMNTEARVAIPYNLSSTGSYDKNNYAQKSALTLRQMGNVSPGTYSQDALATRSMALFLEQVDSPYYSRDLDFTKLISDEFYRKCGIENSQWGTVRNAVVSFQRQSVITLSNTLYGRRNELLEGVGFAPSVTTGYLSDSLDASQAANPSSVLYTDPILNFVAEGETQSSRKYRKEFIDKTLTLMFGSPEIAQESYSDNNQISQAGRTIFSEIVTKKESNSTPYALDKDIIGMIDKGQYPAKAIAEKMGFNNLSQNQFKRAMALLGRGASGSIWSSHDFGVDSLKNCMALSKIPPNWLSISGKGDGDILLDPAISIMRDNEKQFKRFMPYIKQAGLNLEKCQANGDKNGAKAIAKQWRWLAQNDGKSLYTKLDDIESKYKINATWDDYGTLISQSMKTVLHRTLMDISDFDAVDAVNVYDSQLEINYDELTRLMKEHLDSEYIDNWEPPEYDDEDDVDGIYIDDHPHDSELPSHNMQDINEMNLMTINAYLHATASGFKEVLENNQEWHVKSSTLTKEMNNAIDNPIAWDGLLKAPVELPDGYSVHSIDTREALLEEGNKMDHCVFNYLGACLSGESTIFSIRDSDNNRVATLELNPNESDEENEPTTYSLGQCFGYKNENISDELDQYIEKFIDDINSQEIDVSPSIGGGEDMRGILDEVEMDPLNKGYIISNVPYNTHAAHLDFFTLEKMLPANATVEGLLLEESDASLELFHLSKFSKDIAVIRDLSKQYGVAPDNMVRVAIAHEVKKIENLPETMSGLSKARELLITVEEDTSLPLTPVQKAQKAQTLLESEGFNGYNLDVLVDAYASEQAGKSLSLMVMSTKPNEKVDAVSLSGEQIKNDVQNDYRLRR